PPVLPIAWRAGASGPTRSRLSSWRTPSAATASTRTGDAEANSRWDTATGVPSSSAEASKPRPANRSARAAGAIESVLVQNRTVRPWARSHRTASGAPGTTWLLTYRVPSRASGTGSIPPSRPTTHLRHGPPARTSTGHVEQPDHGALGLIPDRDHLRGRQQLHLAAVPREVGGRLLRQRDPALLSGADQQALGALLVEVLGFGQRNGMRGAVDGLGQLLLPRS